VILWHLLQIGQNPREEKKLATPPAQKRERFLAVVDPADPAWTHYATDSAGGVNPQPAPPAPPGTHYSWTRLSSFSNRPPNISPAQPQIGFGARSDGIPIICSRIFANLELPDDLLRLSVIVRGIKINCSTLANPGGGLFIRGYRQRITPADFAGSWNNIGDGVADPYMRVDVTFPKDTRQSSMIPQVLWNIVFPPVPADAARNVFALSISLTNPWAKTVIDAECGGIIIQED